VAVLALIGLDGTEAAFWFFAENVFGHHEAADVVVEADTGGAMIAENAVKIVPADNITAVAGILPHVHDALVT